MFKKLLNRYRIKRRNQALNEARRLIIKYSDQQIGTRGKDKNGTVRELTDILFSVRHNRYVFKYTKIARGVKTNEFKKA